MSVGDLFLGGALVLLVVGGWMLESTFSDHHKRVDELLASIRDELKLLNMRIDPDRDNKIKCILQNLKSEFTSIEDEFDIKFAAMLHERLFKAN